MFHKRNLKSLIFLSVAFLDFSHNTVRYLKTKIHLWRDMMIKKLKFKQICAGLLSLTLLTMAIIPHIGKQEAKAFSNQLGVCIDNHNFSTAGSWSKNDIYTNKMINMNEIQATYGYGSEEYKRALAQNVETLHQRVGSDEQILKLFWAGVVAFVTEGKSFDANATDLAGAQYWINYAQINYRDSVFHGYAPDIPTGYNFVPMNETELGTVLHGAAGQSIINRDPFLAALTNPDTFFSTTTWDAFPQALPRLSNVWLNSYDSYQAGEGGRGQWPKDSAGHEVAGPIGYVPSYEDVQKAALDMDSNPYYYSIQSTKNSPGTYKVEDDEDDDEESGDINDKGNKKDGYYVISCKEDFFNNCGTLNIWDDTLGTWVKIGSLTHYNQHTTVNGWDVFPTSKPDSWTFEFTYTGGNKPTGLVMYFELPQNSITSANQVGFDTPTEFVARFTRLYTCDSCGGTHSSGRIDPSGHQRFVSFYFDENPCEAYPCFRLGDPIPPDITIDTDLTFNIYRHTEEMESNYNVQLNKFDYETGEPLEQSIFELYERFDDKNKVNTERDGAVELYEGGDDTWDSKYISSPVLWDDFRLVGSYTTDTNGHVEEDLEKKYHYEKTFCDGHPAPKFTPVPEPEEDEETGEITNEDEIEKAKEANRAVALQWMAYRDDCESMSQDRDGVHFHWIMDDVNVDIIEEVSSSGGEEGSTPDGGNTTSADIDTAYKNSTCQQDCEDTYDKFINLEYSYTWVEAKSREGYIRHDIHTDDVPIEVITTNSSEAGAESSFSNDYSKDITINNNVKAKTFNLETDLEHIEEDENTEIFTVDEPRSRNTFSLYKANVATASNVEMEEDFGFFGNVKNVLSSYVSNTTQFFNPKVEDETEKTEELEETEESIETATPSNARPVSQNSDSIEDELSNSNIVDDESYEESDEETDDDSDEEYKDYSISFLSDEETDDDTDEEELTESYDDEIAELSSDLMEEYEEAYIQFTSEPHVRLFMDAKAAVSGYSDQYMAVYKKAFEDVNTGGAPIEPGPDDNFSHCNDSDGEGDSWRVYDHRTEGEIHFNKQDFNLTEGKNENYDSYADTNGDGTLEGAVYGLFAAENIVHPDGKTDIVFKKDNLVSVATTDQNGNGSFMAITETPGSVFNYETGKIETTEWTANAPDNLFREGAKNTTVQPNVTFNDGTGTTWTCDDYTEDGQYKGADTQRLYDDNEGNNMNSWIGRPLFMGEYYIKELSRSEGYELSVNGKTSEITNNGADLEVTTNDRKGSVAISQNLYIQGQESIGLANEPFFEVTSKGTNENGGYDVVLTNLPEGTKIYRHDSTTTTGKFQVIDHYENVPKVDENGNPVYKVANTSGIPILKGDGSNDYITSEGPRNYYISDLQIAPIKSFNQSVIDETLKGQGKDDGTGTGTIIYPDFETMKEEFTMGPGSTYYIRFAKAKLEQALRKSGISTPKTTYKQNGTTKVMYSETEYPIYSRGIREGENDTYGISGVTPGSPASKTVYGPQIVCIELNKTNDAGNQLTTGDMIYNLIQYYMDHPYYAFGGIDTIEEEGDTYKVYIYAACPSYTDGFVVAGNDFENDSTIYRALNFDPSGTSLEPYVVYVPYTAYEADDSFGTYEDITKRTTLTGTVKVSARLIPDVEIDSDGNLSPKMQTIYEYYNIGDTIHDKDGNPVQETESVPVYVEKEVAEIQKDWFEVPARYEDGKYIIHVDMPGTDMFGQPIDDTESKTLEFKAVVPETEHTLTQDEIDSLPSSFNYVAGDTMPSGSYEVYVKRAKAFAYLDYEDKKAAGENSYIKDAILTYPDDEYTFQDGDVIPGKGTRLNPIQVMERPIRQQIKVIKDIQTNPDGSYAHDTYSEVHKENLSADGYNRWYTKITDWLTSLIGGTSENETTEKIDNFRFKAYLKSNLERLYRDNDGNIVWLDRYGNVLTPNYIDTNGDGNYDTFNWTRTAQDGSGDSIIDFPEKQLVKDESLKSSNVQKIYTKVEHNTGSTTTGDNSNNTWASYNDPQTGETKNVGQFVGFTTSQDGTNGEAIRANASLYSYDGNNFNVKKTDRINENQNTGYTRLLEMTTSKVEDGAGKTREIQTYNYKKFFDAINAANTDKWDDDMYSSDKNYPGQNWFETFYEKYQKDDADPDHTIENTDGVDKDGTAGGDRDTSFKPFQWIREDIYKENGEERDYYNGTANNPNTENTKNTSTFAHENAEASDAVRQFAIDYYLQDEVAKLVQNNGQDEDEAITTPTYAEEVYDTALHNALIKAVNYLKPFYDNDLDTIYAVEWDTEVNGGADNDYTTLNISETDADKSYYYGISAYLPYGTYVLVEQQPKRIDGIINDFTNKNYKTDNPKEVTLPAVYEGNSSNDTFDNYDQTYFYQTKLTPVELARDYYIRFNEEWADNHTEDLRSYVIRAHNNDGDYEIYKYGLDVDKLTSMITYNGGTYDYDGFSITQETSDPLKDYYNPIHKVNGKNVTSAEGSNNNSHYFADDANGSIIAAKGSHYAENAIEERYQYGSISEHSGTADNVQYPNGTEKDDNNPSGFYFDDGVDTMTGIQTAYEGKYASMLVPWSVTTPVDLDSYHAEDFQGFADIGFRNTFYTLKLRIEKLDSETGENILHDGAIFGLYAASRYTTQEEVDEAIANGAPETTKIGNVKYYLKDTTITGTYEFLKAMGADNIRPYTRIFGEETNQYSGTVHAGTPVCLESEQIILYDEIGAKTGDMTVYTTTNDTNMVAEEDESKAYNDQNTGYFVTPQPIGAGVYVLAELKPPTGYSRTKPIAIEVYSDAVTYYINGDMNSQVEATIYKDNLINK